MMPLMYPHLPRDPNEWHATVEPAKDAYWAARRDGRTETEALLSALNTYNKILSIEALQVDR